MIFPPHVLESVKSLLKQFSRCIIEWAKLSVVLSAARKRTVLPVTLNYNPCLHQLFDHLAHHHAAASLCLIPLPAYDSRGSEHVPRCYCKKSIFEVSVTGVRMLTLVFKPVFHKYENPESSPQSSKITKKSDFDHVKFHLFDQLPRNWNSSWKT